MVTTIRYYGNRNPFIFLLRFTIDRFLQGFKELKEEDKAQLILLLGKTSRKRKREDQENSHSCKALTSLEKKLRVSW